MSTNVSVAIWIIAAGVIVAALYLGRDIFAPFALAVFLFLIIEGFATAINEQVNAIKLGIARIISILLVIGGFVGFLVMLGQGIAQFSGQAGDYESRINDLISSLYAVISMNEAPTLTELLFNEQGQRFFGTLANAVSGVTGDLVLILIYVAFLFFAQTAWPRKLDQIFPDPEGRTRVRNIGAEARRSIETYLWIQTVISALITALTFVTL
ncbi:MAG: AI-2E family transporter, partial [Pseudomonadota bacterium]